MASLESGSLAQFRYLLRCYLRFSERAAQTVGLEPQEYQLLLALRGLATGEQATISDLAETLQVRHHGALG